MRHEYDLAILGDGIVARSLALGARKLGFKSVRIANKYSDYENDPRSYAMAPSSIALFDALGLEDLRVQAPKVKMVELAFDHSFEKKLSIGDGQNTLMHMVDHFQIAKALSGALEDCICLDTEPQDITVNEEGVNFADLDMSARLLAIADGKYSSFAKRMGINYVQDRIEQRAITAKLRVGVPHNNTARQIFTPYGPLGVLPHREDIVSVVWSQDIGRADWLMSCTESQFLEEMQSLVGAQYGGLELISRRAAFDVSSARASRLVGPSFVLAGDSAHVVHPLAGQGLNLGLRDVACLIETLFSKRKLGLDIGASDGLESYAYWRRSDIERVTNLTVALHHNLRAGGTFAVAMNSLSAKFGNAKLVSQTLAKISDMPLSPQPSLLEGLLP